jgi:hypothetical protein
MGGLKNSHMPHGEQGQDDHGFGGCINLFSSGLLLMAIVVVVVVVSISIGSHGGIRRKGLFARHDEIDEFLACLLSVLLFFLVRRRVR